MQKHVCHRRRKIKIFMNFLTAVKCTRSTEVNCQLFSYIITFQFITFICMPKTRKLASLVRKGYKHSKFTELTAFSPAQIFLSGCVNVEIFAHLFSKKEKEKENATQVEYENISFSPRGIKSCIEKILVQNTTYWR